MQPAGTGNPREACTGQELPSREELRSTAPASSRYSLQTGYALLIAGVALAGCAGPSARVPGAGLVALAAPTTSEITGT